MMILKENTANAMSQPIHYNNNNNNNTIHRSYSTIDYDYYHPWDKPNYATFQYQPSVLFPTMSSSTGGISLNETTNKSYSHPSFDITPNLNNTNPNFYRRHTESALPTATSIYASPTNHHHPSTGTFNYSQTTAHHPSELIFGWNNHGPSLMRTHSASYRDYPQSTSFLSYNPLNSSSLNNKTTDRLSSSSSNRALHIGSMNTTPMNTNYPSFFNTIPTMDFSLPPPPLPPSTNSTSYQKHSISSRKKHPRVTPQLRNEILKLKANNPTVFVWEIQQILLQNGICTAQTLPHATVIQRVLNKSPKSVPIIREETKPNVDFVMQTILNNIQNKPSSSSSSVTICLSPSSSPTLTDGETTSECSICLEPYRSGQEVSILSCSHEYHSSCIKEWMMKSRSCPMCRKDIHNQPQFVTLLI